MLTNQILLAQQSLKTTESLEIFPLLWTIAKDIRTEQILSWIGISFAAFAVGLWCLKSYKTFKEEGLRPKVSELIVSFVLVLMLSNSSKNIKDLTLTAKNTMDNFNIPLHQVVNKEVNSR